jgi:hypothetical protein
MATLLEKHNPGVQYHVDHIIPIQGKYVSGLHTQDNLQVLRRDYSLKKFNNPNPWRECS